MKHLKFYFTLGFTLLLVVTFIFLNGRKKSDGKSKSEIPSYELALHQAESLLEEKEIARDNYRLIQVKNLVFPGDSFKGAHRWKVTYKSKSLFQGNKVVGKGGEIYIKVNLKTNNAKLTGYGE